MDTLIKFKQKTYTSSPIFRRKLFSSSILSSTAKGATYGGAAGATIAAISNGIGLLNGKLNFGDQAKIAGAGVLIGAALGAVTGIAKDINLYVNKKTTVDRRLMQDIVETLKKSNFKEGSDFTRDPKTASSLKTKVCIQITRLSGELKLLVNTVADQKLKLDSDLLIKNLPNGSVVRLTMEDRFNNILIATISDLSADVGLIVGICGFFIHHGYPVYLVEVG